VIQHNRSRPPPASKLLKLGVLRAGFALGGLFAPRQTADRAACLFATPYDSSRSRARLAQADCEMQRREITTRDQTIATYVWGNPAREPYALLAHGWSSFGLRFLPWVQRLRRAGLAVVTFDQPGHGHSSGKLCTLPDFIGVLRDEHDRSRLEPLARRSIRGVARRAPGGDVDFCAAAAEIGVSIEV
jgi:hypothetical protein